MRGSPAIRPVNATRCPQSPVARGGLPCRIAPGARRSAASRLALALHHRDPIQLGAGDRVVGVTDFCDFPPEVKQRTRTGSILQPNYEVIARLQPTLILGEQIHRLAHIDRLTAIAPTTILPWLTLDDITTSIRTLGRLVDRSANAEALATRLKTRLSRSAPAKAPRVLLVIGGEPGPLSEIWGTSSATHSMAASSKPRVGATPSTRTSPVRP